MSKPATKTVRYYILSAIGIAIMLFFRFLPPMGTVTELGMNVLGIFPVSYTHLDVYKRQPPT